MSWRHIDGWKDAAEQLGVRISGPVTLELNAGDRVTCELLVERFGAPRGTLVFQTFPSIADAAIFTSGYTYSIFDRPAQGTICSAAELADLLRDWGWCGP